MAEDTTGVPEKMPWESKIAVATFISTVVGFLYSVGIIPATLTSEQVAAIGTIIGGLVFAWRIYGGTAKIVLKKTTGIDIDSMTKE